jgi:hypothetical protein
MKNMILQAETMDSKLLMRFESRKWKVTGAVDFCRLIS